jgi:chromate transporter
LLTFGGAYTAIPFVEHDAIQKGHWLTRRQFLDGLAISSALPAPLIIFATFVGYVGGGITAALVMTAMIFAPAFAFTLLGHRHLERLIANERLHALLDGVTAAVVGLMLVTAVTLTTAALPDVAAGLVLVGALVVLHQWRSRLSIVAVMGGAGLVGIAHALALG